MPTDLDETCQTKVASRICFGVKLETPSLFFIMLHRNDDPQFVCSHNFKPTREANKDILKMPKS